jgi:hypothetical protein
VEITAYGKPGKRWCCFPPFPQALEIKKRFPHYHHLDDKLNRGPLKSQKKLSEQPGPPQILVIHEKGGVAALLLFLLLFSCNPLQAETNTINLVAPPSRFCFCG